MSLRVWLAGYLLCMAPALAGTNSTIVVSATRLDDLDLMAVDTAADVTVIDRDTIEQSGAASVPALLQNEANVLIRSTSGNGNDSQISMRGMGENSHLRTLVLVDGHKANRPDMAGIEWSSIPVSNIEKIEVIRGGQNVLYGNHALSGVVKITTKRGADAGTHAAGSFGSFGFLSGSAGYGASRGNVDLTLGIAGESGDGFRSNSNWQATSVYGSLAWYVGERDTLTLRGSYTDSHRLLPGPLSYDEMMSDPTQSYTNGSDYSDIRSSQATLIWETDRDWGAARLASGFSRKELDWELTGVFAENLIQGISLGPRVRYGSEASFLMGGLDANYDTVDFDNLHPENTAYVQAYADLERVTLAPYLFLQRSFDPGWIVNGGARYETARTDNRYIDYVDNQILPTIELLGIGEIPNPNYQNPPDIDPANSYEGTIDQDGWAGELSLAYDFNRWNTVWAGYDRVYRYPALDESAAYQGYPLSDPLNENLKPETGHNFELGGRWRRGNWNGSLTAFYLMLDDEIAYVYIPADPVAGTPAVSLNMNIGSTRRLGSELEVAFDGNGFGASTRWTLVDARIDGGEYDGNRVPLVPAASGTTAFWVEPDERFRITTTVTCLTSQYPGGDQANEEQKIDAYGLLGLRFNVMLTDHFSLFILMNNLLDKTYASAAYGQAFYPGAGRNYHVGMTWEF